MFSIVTDFLEKATPLSVIYVSGPYTASSRKKVKQNVMQAILIGAALWEKGWAPLVPHLSHWMEAALEKRGRPLGYEAYLSMDLVFVTRCDALFLIAPSPGADREVAAARACGIPVYTALADVPDLR